jgi:ABC-type Zn uptake system ZnuABC Zn-binding protein ZnuA
MPETDAGEAGADADSFAMVLEVFATTRPLCYLVTELAQELAECEVLAPDAESYRPTPERIVEIGDADLIVVNGLGLEPWLEGASLPVSRVVEASATVDPIELEAVTHSHGPEGDHSHRETDPRAWLDPLSFARQADEIAAALARVLPEHQATIEQRRIDLEARLGALVADSRQRLESAIGPGSKGDASSFELASLSSHLRYFSRALGFGMKEFLPDDEGPGLSDHDLEHLVNWIRKAKLPVVVFARQDASGSEAQRQLMALSSVQPSIVELDDLSGGSAGAYDYAALFEDNVARLQAALSAATE